MKKFIVTACIVFLVCFSQMMIFANAEVDSGLNSQITNNDTIDDSDIDTTTSEDDTPSRSPIIPSYNSTVSDTPVTAETNNNYLVIGIIVGGIILVAGGLAAVVIVKRKKS